MTTFLPNGAPPRDPDADRLGDAWDALVAGRHPDHLDVDAGLLAVVERIHAESSPPRPTPAFRDDLRETLMHHASPSAALPMTAPRLVPITGRPIQIDGVPRPTDTSRPLRLRRAGLRWASLAATVALLLATGAGGYLTGVRLPGAGGQATNVAAPVTGSPEATSEVSEAGITLAYSPHCEEYGDYLPCQYGGVVAQALIRGVVVSTETVVRMQGWEIFAGQTTPPADDILPITDVPALGTGIDLVVSGAYVGSFTREVIVTRRTVSSGFTIEIIPTLTPVELVRGDAVTYRLGTKIEVRNPMTQGTLEFKALLFREDGRFSEALLQDASTEGAFRVTEDGVGSIPSSLVSPHITGFLITLTYSRIQTTVSDDYEHGGIVLGPVDSIHGPTESDGYIVWALELMG